MRVVQCLLFIGVSSIACGNALAQSAQSLQSQPNEQTEDTGRPQSAGGVQDIIVTAQRRTESIQDVPVAIAAKSAASLTSQRIESTIQLAEVVPALQVSSSLGYSLPRIRGVGSTSNTVGIDNSVATYVDGVYIASLSGAATSLNNIERIEILKGPQGTLYGRNATGGVINVVTKDPKDTLQGQLSGGYGNYNTVSGSAYVTGGITAALAADLAVYYNRVGRGYGSNFLPGGSYNGQRTGQGYDFASRSKWLWRPSARDTLTLSFDYARRSGAQGFRLAPGAVALGGATDTADRPWDTELGAKPIARNRNGGVSAKYEHDFTNFRFQTLTAYREETHFYSIPIPYNITAQDGSIKSSQFSEELQIQSQESSRVKWVAGLYYLESRVRADPVEQIIPVLAPNVLASQSTSKLKSTSAFGQVTIPLFDRRTNLTVGLRYTAEQRKLEGGTGITEPVVALAPFIPEKKSFRRLTWRFALDHRFSPDLLVYASQSRGIKGGGFNQASPTLNELTQIIEPETLDATEVGVKSDLFGGHVRLNASGFYYNYKAIQVPLYSATGGVIVTNAASARIWGADVDMDVAVTQDLSFNAGFVWLRPRFSSFRNAPLLTPNPVPPGGNCFLNGDPGQSCVGDASGNDLPYSPRFTVSGKNPPRSGGAAVAGLTL